MIFKSKSNPGQEYVSDGTFCNCPGFASSKKCWHIKSLQSKYMSDAFLADDVQVKTFKGNKDEVEVIFRTGSYEWDKIKDFQRLRGRNLKVSVEMMSEDS